MVSGALCESCFVGDILLVCWSFTYTRTADTQHRHIAHNQSSEDFKLVPNITFFVHLGPAGSLVHAQIFFGGVSLPHEVLLRHPTGCGHSEALPRQSTVHAKGH
jgi:hypothetical protein